MKKKSYILVLLLILAFVFCACGKHEHSWKRATCTSPRTCLECGETEGNPLHHQWRDANCTTPKTCIICNETEGSALGHELEPATYNDPAKCKICGAAEGSPKQPGAALSLSDTVVFAWASSVYSGDNLGKHGPENLYDGDLRTNWTEDAPGTGVDEYIAFEFVRSYAFKELQIYTGSHYNESAFKQNCRPKEIQIIFEEDNNRYVSTTISLDDTYEMQTITFDEYYYADTIAIRIKDVYQGTQYEDTVIAEINFLAYLP